MLFHKGSCATEGVKDRQNGYLISESSEEMYELLKRLGIDKKQMAQIGMNAMNELYMSWHDAVLVARERYLQIIKDHQR